jgi:adenosylhomocysteinase
MQPNILYDSSLAPEGRRKIEWARGNMPVLSRIEGDFKENRYFAGLRVAISVHLEAKTAYLAEVFAAGGATVAVTGSNPMSTKDDVVAALADAGIHVYARHGAQPDEFAEHQLAALEVEPHVVIDDGGDLVHRLHTKRPELLASTYGACEETTAGVLRDGARQRAGELRIPVIAVNNAMCKHMFDNRYGTGHSTMDALMRSTNRSITGAIVVVAGYGWCGKGIALRAAGMGARVIVTEVDPVKALEAAHDGYWVLPMARAAELGDFFVTTTGTKRILTGDHFDRMRDGAVLANAGHFFEEIDLETLSQHAEAKEPRRQDVTGYRMPDGRWINVLADGKIVNISAADGHPAEIMDMSFALQAASARYVVEHADRLPPEVIPVPPEIDNEVARHKLEAMGIEIDQLSEEQRTYLEDVEK